MWLDGWGLKILQQELASMMGGGSDYTYRPKSIAYLDPGRDPAGETDEEMALNGLMKAFVREGIRCCTGQAQTSARCS
jgi:hypothetical protein